MPKTKAPTKPRIDLRDACVTAAQEVIAERGLENLSLREVARKLGVSHQAPYKHFASRDHLLAEVMRRCFQRFAASLDARTRFDLPEQDLESLGQQYLRYAQLNPLEYRLMFSTTWPASAEHVDLVQDALHAFNILRDVLRRLHGDSAQHHDRVELDALYIWSTMHGLAGVMSGNCIGLLNLRPEILNTAVSHSMQRMGFGLTGGN